MILYHDDHLILTASGSPCFPCATLCVHSTLPSMKRNIAVHTIHADSAVTAGLLDVRRAPNALPPQASSHCRSRLRARSHRSVSAVRRLRSFRSSSLESNCSWRNRFADSSVCVMVWGAAAAGAHRHVCIHDRLDCRPTLCHRTQGAAVPASQTARSKHSPRPRSGL